jgi:enamine deaminase RidA (YjgF/YER057c/UK114 family)
LAVRYRDAARVGTYRFGHSTADFVVCRECGTVVASLCEIDGHLRGVLNVRTMPDGIFSATPVTSDHGGESVEERITRRARTWIGTVSFGPADANAQTRQKVFSGASFEKTAAYSRATRVGDLVFVAGTTAVDEAGRVIGVGSLFDQTDYVLDKIARALAECGASLRDVVRTRSFVTDMSQFGDFAKAHRKRFEGIDPVATCVQVGSLVDPDMLVEVEVDAVVASAPAYAGAR